MKKPIITGVVRTHANAFKPPYIKRDPQDEYVKEPRVVFVADGKQRDLPATPGVWANVRGKAQSKRHHSGYDGRTDDDFCVCYDRAKEVVVAIHCFPKHDFNRTSQPKEQVDLETIDGEIDDVTGEITIKSYPTFVRKKALIEILRLIDEKDSLDVGMVISKDYGCTVKNMAGNTFTLTATRAEEKPVTTLDEVMSGHE